jgi:hypothetical protein
VPLTSAAARFFIVAHPAEFVKGFLQILHFFLSPKSATHLAALWLCLLKNFLIFLKKVLTFACFGGIIIM